MNYTYKEYKEKLKEEFEAFKEKLKLKLEAFKEKQKKDLEKFKNKLKKPNNKKKSKVKGGSLTDDQLNKITKIIAEIYDEYQSNINKYDYDSKYLNEMISEKLQNFLSKNITITRIDIGFIFMNESFDNKNLNDIIKKLLIPTDD